MQSSIALQDVQGLPFRLALNEALQTLITQNAGPAEPNPTYAFQPWADTTTGILKQRNAANNDWVEILDLATGRPVGAVAQTSPTGALLLAEGTDTQRPAPAEIPAGVAAVRGNSTSLADCFLELWNRKTEVWDALASRFWVGQQIAAAVNALQSQVTALKAIRFEPEALWIGSAGNVVELTLSREVLEGELLVLKHVTANTGLTNPQVYLPSVGHQVDGGTYFAFNTGSANTGATLRKPAVAGGPSVMKMLTYTSGYSVAGIYAIKQKP